jgi:protein-S-isoprenylcysteine O-methyltransferase Ste14
MYATRFEFEQRFWIIGAIFGLGFYLYAVDPTNVAVAILRAIAPSVDPDSAAGNDRLRFIFGAGAVLVLVAAWLRTWATAYLRTEIVHDAMQHSEGLVADGPYRYVRNPLYLANLPLIAGVGVMASRLGWIVMVFGMWVFMYRLIRREEDGLRRTQGASYRAYLCAVPRLWPSLRPQVASGGGRARWGQAIGGELFAWLLAAAVLCFAITLNIKLAGIVFASSLAVYFIVVPLIKKRAAPHATAGDPFGKGEQR